MEPKKLIIETSANQNNINIKRTNEYLRGKR
jgi:hypothetical protein